MLSNQSAVSTTDPEGVDLSEIGGKSLALLYEYSEPKPVGPNKEYLCIVTDDGSVYRWSRFEIDTRYTFDCRIKPDGRADTARRQLPKVVKEIIDARVDEDDNPLVLYR